MGTNFYLRGHRHDDDPEYHIGKRSAAGPYCWDCKQTLCADRGEAGIHFGKSKWHDACPKCNNKAADEGLSASAAGRELGFNKSQPAAKTGVQSCSSFSWAMPRLDLPEQIGVCQPVCPSCNHPYTDPEKVIEDEYGRLFTLAEFTDMLAECPVQYTRSVGTAFS